MPSRLLCCGQLCPSCGERGGEREREIERDTSAMSRAAHTYLFTRTNTYTQTHKHKHTCRPWLVLFTLASRPPFPRLLTRCGLHSPLGSQAHAACPRFRSIRLCQPPSLSLTPHHQSDVQFESDDARRMSAHVAALLEALAAAAGEALPETQLVVRRAYLPPPDNLLVRRAAAPRPRPRSGIAY